MSVTVTHQWNALKKNGFVTAIGNSEFHSKNLATMPSHFSGNGYKAKKMVLLQLVGHRGVTDKWSRVRISMEARKYIYMG